jgi:flagellar biosynthetic protein FlhB
MAQESADTGHGATARRRREAREHGRVARSRELVFAVVFFAAVLVTLLRGPHLWRLAQAELRESIRAAAAPRAASELLDEVLPRRLAAIGWAIAPGFLVLSVAAVLGHWVQHGPLWLPGKVVPDWSNLHPAVAWFRLRSNMSWGRTLIVLFKCSLMASIAVMVFQDQQAAMVGLARLSVEQLVGQSAALLGRMAAWLGLGLLVSAAADYAWQLWRYERDLRMSPEQLRDEIKSVQNDVSALRRRRPAPAAQHDSGKRASSGIDSAR